MSSKMWINNKTKNVIKIYLCGSIAFVLMFIELLFVRICLLCAFRLGISASFFFLFIRVMSLFLKQKIENTKLWFLNAQFTLFSFEYTQNGIKCNFMYCELWTFEWHLNMTFSLTPCFRFTSFVLYVSFGCILFSFVENVYFSLFGICVRAREGVH